MDDARADRAAAADAARRARRPRARAARGLPRSRAARAASARRTARCSPRSSSDCASGAFRAFRFAEAYRAQQPNTFMYLFTYESPAMRGALRACHALELPFVFGTLDAPVQAASRAGASRDSAERAHDGLRGSRSRAPAIPSCGLDQAWPAYDSSAARRWCSTRERARRRALRGRARGLGRPDAPPALRAIQLVLALGHVDDQPVSAQDGLISGRRAPRARLRVLGKLNHGLLHLRRRPILTCQVSSRRRDTSRRRRSRPSAAMPGSCSSPRSPSPIAPALHRRLLRTGRFDIGHLDHLDYLRDLGRAAALQDGSACG